MTILIVWHKNSRISLIPHMHASDHMLIHFIRDFELAQRLAQQMVDDEEIERQRLIQIEA